MSLKTYDYECPTCERVDERTVDYDDRDKQACRCGGNAQRLMSAPAIHTLETHMRGYNDSDGKFVPSHGGFRDENLCIDGKPQIYNSPREKQALLDKAGLYQKDDRPETRRKSERPKYFGNVGSHKGSQV